jgi:hypothetical protein
VQIPDLQYARSDEVAIAYQTVGTGSVAIVFARGEWRLDAVRAA